MLPMLLDGPVIIWAGAANKLEMGPLRLWSMLPMASDGPIYVSN
jgi:hypothetical protein